MSRDIQSAYRDAMVAEYASYQVAGRTEDAEHVAAALKARFDYDVDAPSGPDSAPEAEATSPEHAAEQSAPETTAEPAPARTAKRAAPGRTGRTGT